MLTTNLGKDFVTHVEHALHFKRGQPPAHEVEFARELVAYVKRSEGYKKAMTQSTSDSEPPSRRNSVRHPKLATVLEDLLDLVKSGYRVDSHGMLVYLDAPPPDVLMDSFEDSLWKEMRLS